jgi:hypothetical protein
LNFNQTTKELLLAHKQIQELPFEITEDNSLKYRDLRNTNIQNIPNGLICIELFCSTHINENKFQV